MKLNWNTVTSSKLWIQIYYDGNKQLKRKNVREELESSGKNERGDFQN